ncbi:MAG: ferrous iron transport protein B [Candidatus Nanopelagicales bacterium]|nr:ferrous iron transport protein B [Candidatus Nanopelagicales bacterium]
MTERKTIPSMASCHSDAAGPLAARGAPVVALVGAPNVGKSTLFNSLTGARRQMGNWPGTTVEVGRTQWRVPAEDGSEEVALLDLPGAYSLDALSPDEEFTRALLLADDRPDIVIVVADASRLSRSLYLLSQVRESAQRVVVALTMSDVAARRAIEVDIEVLSSRLGCPVVRVDPRRGIGDADLARAAADVFALPVPAARNHPDTDDDLELADDRFAWIQAAVDDATVVPDRERRTWSDRLDRWVTAPWIGPVIFMAVMWAVFQLTTTVAAPLQDALDVFFAGPVSSAAAAVLSAVGLGGTWVESFVIDGLIAGVGMLLTFVPLMAIMFALLALLEDSGYMARAAVVTDRTMRFVGLPGKAFLPLIVGFGCNVPAISATRVLPDARHRILTALLVPFTSCSARLAVYVMLAATFFPDNAGNVVFAMYLISILFVVVVGLALRKTLWATMGREALLLDLPAYQLPHLKILGVVTWGRLKGFLRTASGIIVAAVAAVWFLQAIPVDGQGGFADVPVQNSAYAAASQAITPVFAPAGFGNWEAVGALAVGFVAKEAVISSWSQTYAVAAPEDLRTPGDLGDALKSDFAVSSGGHTTAAVWAFLVFLLAYTPCVATLATQRREIGRKWTLFGIAMQLSVAWIVAVAVFQIGRVLT